MALPHNLRRFTPAEYLTIERQSPFKSELVDGQMYAMTGATREHNLIAVNVAGELRARLKGRPCETYASDMRVRFVADDDYYYPDVKVVCGQPSFEDNVLDTLLNPTLIVEVLSESTAQYDRTTKRAVYTRIASLQVYVLIAQDQPRVEVFRRAGSTWVGTVVEDIDATVELAEIGCVLPMAEVYDRVAFA
jgi:Uma2 family endonuclease